MREKAEEGRTGGKFFAKVNILLKVRFAPESVSVEKRARKLCKVHRKRQAKCDGSEKAA